MKSVILIGAGGHASVIIDIIESMKNRGEKVTIKGLLDDRADLTEFMSYKVLDKIDNACLYNDDNTEFVIAIGNNKVRKSISERLCDLKYFTAIHSSAIVGSNVDIGDGTVVMPRSVINANTTIGNHVIVNSGAIVEHDNVTENCVHISPGCTLCGGVSVGESTHIGANSTVIPCVKIGSNSVVGAGSTVINDIGSNVMSVGSPARVIKNI